MRQTASEEGSEVDVQLVPVIILEFLQIHQWFAAVRGDFDLLQLSPTEIPIVDESCA